MKQKNQNKPWTPEDTHLVMTSKLNMEKIAKKLKRTKKACFMRRHTFKKANAEQYNKVQKQAKDLVKQADHTLAIIKKRRVIKKPAIGSAINKPVLKVKSFSYEGRHSFITVNKLNWLTRTILGVKETA